MVMGFQETGRPAPDGPRRPGSRVRFQETGRPAPDGPRRPGSRVRFQETGRPAPDGPRRPGSRVRFPPDQGGSGGFGWGGCHYATAAEIR
jgi:hypothetical protein